MRKIISALLSIFMIAGLSNISFAEEREYQLDGFISNDITKDSTLFKNYVLGLKSIISVENASTADTKELNIISYNSTDYATDNGRGIIVRYDISDVPADADIIKVSIAVTKRSSNAYYNKIINNEFVLGVYALEGLGDNWNRQSTPWSALFDGGTPLTRSQLFSNRVSEIINNEEGYYDEPETGAVNLPLNGRRLLADVTEYVKAKKAAGANTIDLLFAPESHGSNPDDHTALSLNFESIAYSYSAASEAAGRLFRPGVLWYSVVKSEINTIEDLSVTNGILSEEFDPEATDEGEELKKTYNIGVIDSTKPVMLECGLTSPYASYGENIKREGNTGDTLVIPVISESGVKREYIFRIMSLEDAGFSENGKISADKFSFSKAEIEKGIFSADMKNTSIEEKNGAIVIFEQKNNGFIKMTVIPEKIRQGNSKLSEEFTPEDETDYLSAYVASSDNLFKPLSNIVRVGTPTEFIKKENPIEIYYKDLSKNELTVSGKSEADMPVFIGILNKNKLLSDYNGSNADAIFAYAAGAACDKDGYFGCDVKMPSGGDYTVFVEGADGNINELKIYYATPEEKESAINDIYSSGSAEELRLKLNLSLSDDERKLLEEKYNNGDEDGQKNYVKLLGLESSDFENGMSDKNFSETLFGYIKDDGDKSKFSGYYSDALFIAELNAGKIDDISEYLDEIGADKPIGELYNKLPEADRKNISSKRLAGNNFTDYRQIKKAFEEQTVLVSFASAGNIEAAGDIVLAYSDLLEIKDYIAKYKSLRSSSRQEVIKNLLKASPYETIGKFAGDFGRFTDSAYSANNQSGSAPSGGGGSIGSSGGRGSNQKMDVSGIESGDELFPDVINNKRVCGFADIDGFEWAKEAIAGLYEDGVIDGVSEKSFMPGKEVKREEFLKMADRLYEGTGTNTLFSDADKSAWYYGYISKAVGAGITKGVGDNIFGVGKSLTREDAAVMIARMILENEPKYAESIFKDNTAISDYAKASIGYLKELGIMNGDEKGNFNPKKPLRRAEAAVLISNVMKKAAN